MENENLKFKNWFLLLETCSVSGKNSIFTYSHLIYLYLFQKLDYLN